jgi:hypothetical protein
MGAEGTTEREPIIIAWLDPDMPEDRHCTPQPHGNRLVGPRHINGSSANGCSPGTPSQHPGRGRRQLTHESVEIVITRNESSAE